MDEWTMDDDGRSLVRVVGVSGGWLVAVVASVVLAGRPGCRGRRGRGQGQGALPYLKDEVVLEQALRIRVFYQKGPVQGSGHV